MWTIETTYDLLSKQPELVVTKEDDCIFITNEDGLDAYLSISGNQMIVESLLCLTQQVKDNAGFNELVLKTQQQLFPLTSVAITSVGDEDYYAAFGALSSQSKDESVLIEIELLFQNVEGMLECYEEFI